MTTHPSASHPWMKRIAALAVGLGLASMSALAAADTNIRMVLNWKYQGPQAWFFIAQDKGYFK